MFVVTVKKKLLKLTSRQYDVLFDIFECFYHSESLEFCFGLFCEREFKQNSNRLIDLSEIKTPNLFKHKCTSLQHKGC